MVSVTTPTLCAPPASVALEVAAIASVALSLSVSVIFCIVVGPRIRPADGFEAVSVAVSLPSTNLSSATVNVTLPTVWPLRIVMVLFDSV